MRFSHGEAAQHFLSPSSYSQMIFVRFGGLARERHSAAVPATPGKDGRACKNVVNVPASETVGNFTSSLQL
jgi:hypothetical protein